MADLPIIAIFSPTPVLLQTPRVADYETRSLDCRWFTGDRDLPAILARERPHVLVSFGARREYSRLQAAPPAVQQKWLHFEGAPDAAKIEAAGALAFARFLQLALAPPRNEPLVSVFTPTFRTGETRLQRAYESLRNQEYSHWEWIVVDDSDDDGQTLRLLQVLAAREPRLKIFPSARRSGVIGELKRRACALCEGEILLELDHDDALTPRALRDVVTAFAQFPEAGFVSSDCAEISEETGESLRYGDNWAFGYGHYYEEECDGKTIAVAQTPPLNCETIRHIVGVPNHLRAWREKTYWQIGGHNAALHVADDYELLVRTFLQTRLAHIPRLRYLQYQSGGQNTTDFRRREIQRLVRAIAQFYDRAIHERLLELGLEDAAWDEANGGARFPFLGLTGPRQMRHGTLTAKV